ncbi:MAG: extracellular solute-binding protein [Alphaproteobacteria bacterium]|nr:extracellular solute-binding protein [Alphaproteobacteria bacterium]
MQTNRLAAIALAALIGTSASALAQSKQVVVYSSNEATLHQLVFTDFEKATGIKVQPVEAGSGVILKRVQTEKDRPQGDVIWGISRSLLQANKQYFQPYASANKAAIPAEYRDPDDLWIGNNLHIMVILQNTKILPDDQGPKTWANLLDPKWRGKIAFTDPANSGSAYSTATLMVDLFGGGDAGWSKVTEFFRNAKVLNRSSLVFQGVGNGEYPLGVSLEYAGYVWAANGAPVKVIYPADGSMAQMEGVAVIKGGPNPEAAKAFVDFVNAKATREAILAKTFRRPTRQDIDLSKLPGNMPQLNTIKMVPYKEQAWTDARPDTMPKIQDIIVKTR